jgi:predicted transcriptional regulator
MVYGVGASFLVPLFLRTIDSSLLDRVCNPAADDKRFADVLVFFGLCLVAAIYSKTFMQTISDRVLKEVREAKTDALEAKKDVHEIQAQVDPIIAKETEPDSVPDVTSDDGRGSGAQGDRVADATIDDKDRATLKALANQKFTLRTRTGIAQEAALEKTEVNSIVAKLVEKGLAGATGIGNNKIRYFITEKGRRLVAGR